MLDIHSIMKSLKAKRPIFHSEADFQRELEREIKELLTSDDVMSEFNLFPNENTRMDIWVPSVGTIIELKYPQQKLNVMHKGRRFSLKEHSAEDLGRYDFVKDIRRIERAVGEREEAKRGIAILLTNDASYWSPPAPNWQSTQDAAFRLHGGNTLRGTRAWSENAGPGTIKDREAPIVLKGMYNLDWRNYSKLGDERHSRFQYLAVEVSK